MTQDRLSALGIKLTFIKYVKGQSIKLFALESGTAESIRATMKRYGLKPTF